MANSEVDSSKNLTEKSLPMIKAGGKSTGGPTSSSRSYPKGGKPSTTPDFNPVRKAGSTYGLGGA